MVAAASVLCQYLNQAKLTFLEVKIHVEKIEVRKFLAGCNFFQHIGELFCSLNTKETRRIS